jgi:hypothetical protein
MPPPQAVENTVAIAMTMRVSDRLDAGKVKRFHIAQTSEAQAAGFGPLLQRRSFVLPSVAPR